MLYDGIKLAEGSDAKNLVVETGTSFPTGPNRTPDAGELFYRTDAGNVGLWVFDGFIWQRLGTGSGELPDIVPAGTYRSVTVSTKGLVTAGTNPTTLAGYGITDAAPLGHVGAGGGAHATATTSAHGFMSSTDKTKLDGLNIGTFGGTIPLLNGSNIWSGQQIFIAAPVRIDGNSTGQYSVFQTYHAGGSSNPSWAISMETDRDYQIEARDTLGASAARIRVDHASAATGNVLFVGPSALTYGGNSIYHAGNLSFGSGLSFNSGVLSASAAGYTAGNGLTLVGSEFALTGSFSGNTLYHSGNLSFGSGLSYVAGVLTATGGGGAGNINYTPVAAGAATLVAGSRTLATIVNNDPAWASTVAVLPFRTGFTEDKSSIAFTPSADAVINSTNTLFGRNTLFFDGVAPDGSPGTTNFVQATSGDFPTALRLTGQPTFSIDCWLYNTGTGIRFVAGNLVDNTGATHWLMMLNTTAGGAATVSFATSGATYRFGTAAFPQNEWRYVRIAATGGQIACFTATTPGGAETQLGTTLAYTNAVAGTTTAPFRIGRASSWSSGTGYPFSGSIANFRVTIGNARGGLVAGTAPAADFIGDIADFTLPTTIAAGDVFAVRNAAANAGTSFARLVVDSNRRVRPFAQGESILAAPGEEITVVASSNTELEVIAPQFDPRDIPQTIRNQNFTFGMGDRGELAIKTDANAYTWTIALDGVVNMPIGTTVLVGNDSSTGNVTISPSAGVTLLDGAAVGTFTLLPNTFRSLVKVGANRWRIS